MKVAVVGVGYVGSAVEKSHEKHTVIVCDPTRPDSVDIKDIKGVDAIYVCVPSPATPHGNCDTTILESVLRELDTKENKSIPIISKTTAPPDIYYNLNKQYQNLVHCPEFLTAENNHEDYARSEFFILGGRDDFRSHARNVIASVLPRAVAVLTDIRTAAFYKYMVNCYLATKVTFMNEFHTLSKSLGVEWEDVINIAKFEDRIGKSHMQVPGPDGKFGWGGACFPKDTLALLREAQHHSITLTVLGCVVETNQQHRKNQDNE